MKQVARQLRLAVAHNDPSAENSLLKVYILLVAAKAECRLSKLLHQPHAFTATEIAKITTHTSHLNKWTSMVELCFRKRHNVPKATLSNHTLPHDSFTRYQSILEVLNNRLSIIIESRNKLAHGQWHYPINNKGTSVSYDIKSRIDKENPLSIQLKDKLVSALLDSLHDLAVSPPTFDRDFNKHYLRIQQLEIQLDKKPYNNWRSMLIARHNIGKSLRQQNTN